MHVLILGGNRFVGALVAWRLLARGDQVTLLNRGTLPDPFGERVARIQVDRTKPELQGALSGRAFDVVVDFAAFQGRDVESVLGALADRVGHYVLISTGQVYLVRDGCPRPAREEDYDGPLMAKPTEPRALSEWSYGVGKRECEDALVKAWAERQVPSTRIRIPMVNGERDYLRRIEGYLWRLLDGGPLLLPDGGGHLVRHVYGAEVARAVVEMLGRKETFGRAFNLAQEETPTLSEVLSWLAAELGAPLRTLDVPRETLRKRGLEPVLVSPFSGEWMSFLNPERARRELGFLHQPVRSYIGRIVACFLAHPPVDRPEGYRRRREELDLAEDIR
jgi:nucleoside-diphosphate-sugar epimerase